METAISTNYYLESGDNIMVTSHKDEKLSIHGEGFALHITRKKAKGLMYDLATKLGIEAPENEKDTA